MDVSDIGGNNVEACGGGVDPCPPPEPPAPPACNDAPPPSTLNAATEGTNPSCVDVQPVIPTYTPQSDEPQASAQTAAPAQPASVANTATPVVTSSAPTVSGTTITATAVITVAPSTIQSSATTNSTPAAPQFNSDGSPMGSTDNDEDADKPNLVEADNGNNNSYAPILLDNSSSATITPPSQPAKTIISTIAETVSNLLGWSNNASAGKNETEKIPIASPSVSTAPADAAPADPKKDDRTPAAQNNAFGIPGWKKADVDPTASQQGQPSDITFAGGGGDIARDSGTKDSNTVIVNPFQGTSNTTAAAAFKAGVDAGIAAATAALGAKTPNTTSATVTTDSSAQITGTITNDFTWPSEPPPPTSTVGQAPSNDEPPPPATFPPPPVASEPPATFPPPPVASEPSRGFDPAPSPPGFTPTPINIGPMPKNIQPGRGLLPIDIDIPSINIPMPSAEQIIDFLSAPVTQAINNIVATGQGIVNIEQAQAAQQAIAQVVNDVQKIAQANLENIAVQNKLANAAMSSFGFMAEKPSVVRKGDKKAMAKAYQDYLLRQKQKELTQTIQATTGHTQAESEQAANNLLPSIWTRKAMA